MPLDMSCSLVVRLCLGNGWNTQVTRFLPVHHTPVCVLTHGDTGSGEGWCGHVGMRLHANTELCEASA